MGDEEKFATTEILEGVVRNGDSDKISLYDLTIAMKNSSFGVIMLIFSLPILAPLPPPTPSLIAIPLLFFSSQMLWGSSRAWLPKWLERFSFKRKTLALVVEKTSPFMKKVEKLIRPRLVLTDYRWVEKTIGFLSFIFAASIMIPIPLTNSFPGIGIILMSLGLIGRDGVVMIAGALIGIFGLFLTTLILVFGKEVISFIF